MSASVFSWKTRFMSGLPPSSTVAELMPMYFATEGISVPIRNNNHNASKEAGHR